MKHPRFFQALTLVFTLPFATASAAETEIFNTVGTFNWICPPGVTSITVEAWGGGGAGGGTYVTIAGSANAGGGGGGGGAYARLDSVPVTPGNTYTITIPEAAVCPSGSNAFTNSERFDGSPVTFTGDGGVTVTANGGQGGQCRIVSTATASSGSNGAGGAAGTGLDAAFSGGTSTQWGGGNGNGGGGGAGDLGDGGGAAASSGSFGAGGEGSDSAHTGGNGGAARNGAGTGNPGASPGGGGGGAKSTANSKTWRAGGRGGLGQIILTYTMPPAASKTKANNVDNLNLGSSWVGGAAPTSLELAKWDATVTSANTTVLGADLTWSGILIENPAGPVTIGGANTLTLGSALVDIGMASATSDLTVNAPIVLGNENLWDIAASRILTLGGAVSGDFPLTMQGTGVVRLGTGDLLPDGAGNGNITLNATLDLNGNSDTVNGLSGTGTVDNTAGSTSSTLTVGGNNQNSTFDGVLQNSGTGATLNLVKTGSGQLALNGLNTFAGTISIAEGTLGVNGANPIDNVTGITMGDGTMLRAQETGTTVISPITLAGAGTSATIAAPLLPPDNVGASTFKEFNVNGVISGDGDLVLAGINPYNQYGRINIGAQNTYTGATLITTLSGYDDDAYVTSSPPNNANIFVRLNATDALPTTTVLTLDGGDGGGSAPGRYCELNLNGNSQTLAGVTNVTDRVGRLQRIVNSSATAVTLTVNNSVDYTYSGQLGWASGVGTAAYNNLGLTKSGVGTFTISGINNYTGDTTLTGGTLALGASTALPAGTAVSIAAATLDVGVAVSAATTGTLNCTGAAVIHLGDAASAIAFGDSSALTWTGTLHITGDFVSGASIKFGDGSGAGLSAGQLAQITVAGFNNIGIDGSGFLTATPAAGGYTTWAGDNAGGQNPDQDFDGDGVANGVEFFLNAPAGFTALPALNGSNTITWTNGGNLPAAAYGTEFVIQTSNDLVVWVDVLIAQLAANTDGPGGSLSYQLDGVAPRFVRLKVTPTP